MTPRQVCPDTPPQRDDSRWSPSHHSDAPGGYLFKMCHLTTGEATPLTGTTGWATCQPSYVGTPLTALCFQQALFSMVHPAPSSTGQWHCFYCTHSQSEVVKHNLLQVLALKPGRTPRQVRRGSYYFRKLKCWAMGNSYDDSFIFCKTHQFFF